MKENPINHFQIQKADLKFIGEGLQRPECILAERDGNLWAADARGGVMKISPAGAQTLITQTADSHFGETESLAERLTEGTLPNGLAFAANGDILIANFGTDALEVMSRQGQTKTLYDTIDGKPIGKVNFVLRDSRGRIWLTISTRIKNWHPNGDYDPLVPVACSRLAYGSLVALQRYFSKMLLTEFGI